MSRVADRLVVPAWLAATAAGWVLVLAGWVVCGLTIVTVVAVVVGVLAGVRVADVELRRGLERAMGRLAAARARPAAVGDGVTDDTAALQADAPVRRGEP